VGRVRAVHLEVPRLGAELARVKMERDILKKATAYFAKESL
jgi:transposase